MPEVNVTLGAAFLAGLVSFLSPCVLPLIPTYLAYLAGVSVTELAAPGTARLRLLLLTNALLFVAGFSLVFVALGLSASALGKLLLRHQNLLRQVSGVLIIFFGLHMAGLLRLKWLMKEKRVHFIPQKAGWLNSLLMGMAFSAGWVPCIGPVLASILLLAGQSESLTRGVCLLASYSLGMALPFLAAALGAGYLMQVLRRHASLLPVVARAGGWLLVGMGLLVLSNAFARLSSFVPLSL
ncbi:cytochrome c biogenesis CcdA family protein [Desulfofundulus thermocisternus]|uniref:cytochrome c biogenesis CcdA family protein n=1 Tax=Desulfofundulus thermocisternus TaxID=42471 RepID=UPI00055115D3|nr:cytochrome c biogenesis protein CcdA [Desulfofundulus thermocisternus]